MELANQEIMTMLLAFVVGFALGYFCWKHKARLVKGLFVLHALAWGGGWFSLSLLSWANPERSYQGLHEMLTFVLFSAAGILVSSFFLLIQSNSKDVSDETAR
jgi:hypothetical protein